MVQQILLGGANHFSGPFACRSDTLAHNEGLLGCRVLCHGRHANSVHAIDPPGECVILGRILTNELTDDALHLLQQLLMTGDKPWVGSAANENRALADLPCAFDLDPRFFGVLPCRTDDAGPPVVDGVIGRATKVKASFRLLNSKWVTLLIKAMGRHRHRGCAALRRHALKLKSLMVECRQNRIATTWNAAK